MQGLEIKRLFYKPVYKPDVVKPGETGEIEPNDRDVTCPVRRGHPHPRETARDAGNARRTSTRSRGAFARAAWSALASRGDLG